ncbi:MAG: inosine/xanthosine triphosphatase [Candidatus Shapirobacteria bacterium]|jgi:inosine/xanthosine triphosphatase
MKKVIVASTNPVKIKAVELGFKRMFPNVDFNIIGVSAPSGVSDQPLSEEETLTGAKNRVQSARKLVNVADFWVGVEGGTKESGKDLVAFAWIVIESKNNQVGQGRTGSFFLPSQVARLIKQGYELGHADDIVYKQNNSKQANGAIGILTEDVLTRTTFFETAVILALIPFKNPDLY